MIWQPWENESAILRLRQELATWAGTPYMAGQQARGRGVDCIRFVTGVLDAMNRSGPTETERLAASTSWANAELAFESLKFLLESFPCDAIDGAAEPGDIIVLRSGSVGGPGHVLLVGPDPFTVWHSIQPVGVVRSGFSLVNVKNIVRHWRCRERESWA